jgi:hypothetical protein
MVASKRGRKNLSLRLQPYEGTLLVGVEVELPVMGEVLGSSVKSVVKNDREKEKVEVNPLHPKSEFGAVEGLDDLFG